MLGLTVERGARATARSGAGHPAAARAGLAGAKAGRILLVVADDLGREVGAYGQEVLQTPVLDRLAAEGLPGSTRRTPAPTCAPSRCSLLTGLHSGHARVRSNTHGRRPCARRT